MKVKMDTTILPTFELNDSDPWIIAAAILLVAQVIMLGCIIVCMCIFFKAYFVLVTLVAKLTKDSSDISATIKNMTNPLQFLTSQPTIHSKAPMNIGNTEMVPDVNESCIIS